MQPSFEDQKLAQHIWDSVDDSKTPFLSKLKKKSISYSTIQVGLAQKYPFVGSHSSKLWNTWDYQGPIFMVPMIKEYTSLNVDGLWLKLNGPYVLNAMADQITKATQLSKLRIEKTLFTHDTGGLAAWLPIHSPSNTHRIDIKDNFYGVNRSIDPVRLAGNFVIPGLSLTESIFMGVIYAQREGGNPNLVLVGPETFANLKKIYNPKSFQFKDDIDSIVINSPWATITIQYSNECPEYLAYALDMTTWSLYFNGPELTEIAIYDNPHMDVKTIKISKEYALACDDPGKNSVVMLYSPW
jgi:hypothetical protein